MPKSDDGGLVVPTTSMSLDDQGRVVITDPDVATAVQQVLDASDPSDAKIGNLRLDGNTGCANVAAYCG